MSKHEESSERAGETCGASASAGSTAPVVSATRRTQSEQPEVKSMENTDKSAADVLSAAADIVERGWCQGTYHKRASYCFCAKGALMVAAGYRRIQTRNDDLVSDRVNNVQRPGEHIYLTAKRELVKVVPCLDDDHTCPIAEWNDATGRTQADVVATLREAAALAKAEGR